VSIFIAMAPAPSDDFPVAASTSAPVATSILRPVRKILAGWHVERGCLWPYVLVANLVSPLTVRLILDQIG